MELTQLWEKMMLMKKLVEVGVSNLPAFQQDWDFSAYIIDTSTVDMKLRHYNAIRKTINNFEV